MYPHRKTTPVQKALAFVLVLIPPILLTIALAFALTSMYRTDFALAQRIAIPTDFNAPAELANHTMHASPFYRCNSTTATLNDTDVNAFTEDCYRVPYLGVAGFNACPEAGTLSTTEAICQKVVSSASLYVAGAVLVGLATLFAWLTAIARLPELVREYPRPTGYVLAASSHHEGNNHANAEHEKHDAVYAIEQRSPALITDLVTGLGVLLAAASVGCLVLGQVLGVDALTDNQLPSVEATDRGYQGRWYMGPAALVYTTVAYVMAFIGTMFWASRFGKGRI